MTHQTHPISRAEFARRAGRGRSRITEACGPGGALEAACLDGGRLDASHPAALAWAERRGIPLPALLEPSAPPSLEDLLTDAAELFARRVAAAVRSGDVEPQALVVVLDLLGSLLTDTRRRLVAAAPNDSPHTAQPASSAPAA